MATRPGGAGNPDRPPWWRRDFPNHWMRLGLPSSILWVNAFISHGVILGDYDPLLALPAVASLAVVLVGVVKWRRTSALG